MPNMKDTLISHDDVAVLGDGNAARVPELPCTLPFASETQRYRAVVAEHLPRRRIALWNACQSVSQHKKRIYFSRLFPCPHMCGEHDARPFYAGMWISPCGWACMHGIDHGQGNKQMCLCTGYFYMTHAQKNESKETVRDTRKQELTRQKKQDCAAECKKASKEPDLHPIVVILAHGDVAIRIDSDVYWHSQEARACACRAE
jgi:hypothetical protein